MEAKEDIAAFFRGRSLTLILHKKPIAEEILKEDVNADDFQLDDTVFQTNSEWVGNLEFTKAIILLKVFSFMVRYREI
ncbi:hypothetical protein ACQKGI_02825 [Peribacillus muralis]|uniref:hypothetical protein n=1 Tax=Peribacillus muralis TaxID=264697 RepID=UPI0038012CCB